MSEISYNSLSKLIKSKIKFVPLGHIPHERVKGYRESPVILEIETLDELKTLKDTHPELFL